MYRLFLISLMCGLIAGCQSPVLIFPGKALAGEVKETTSFAFARRYRLLQLEVNPAAPYSVLLRTTLINDALYIDAAPARRWGRQLNDDRRVRVKLGASVYPAIAVPVVDPKIVANFRQGRTIYRLEPVSFSRQSARKVQSGQPSGHQSPALQSRESEGLNDLLH